jgi:hypothetical protein
MWMKAWTLSQKLNGIVIATRKFFFSGRGGEGRGGEGKAFPSNLGRCNSSVFA